MRKRRCDKFCPNLIFSNSVTVITVAGVDTLVIDLPDNNYRNCMKFCIGLIQPIPDEATINMPVAVSIGGDTTTVFPLVECNGLQVIASQLVTDYQYRAQVFTTATAGIIRIYNLPNCVEQNVLDALPT